jgi:hypothetical protein
MLPPEPHIVGLYITARAPVRQSPAQAEFGHDDRAAAVSADLELCPA